MENKEKLAKLFEEIEELRSFMFYFDEASSFQEDNELYFMRDIIRYMCLNDEFYIDSESEDCESEFRTIIFNKAKEKIDAFINDLN